MKYTRTLTDLMVMLDADMMINLRDSVDETFTMVSHPRLSSVYNSLSQDDRDEFDVYMFEIQLSVVRNATTTKEI
jgi:hypothetical protein